MRTFLFVIRLLRTTAERVMRRAVSLAARAALYVGFEVLTVVAVGAGFALGLSSCRTQQALPKTTVQSESVAEDTLPQWHTCSIQGAKAVLTYEGQTLTATCSMQAVRDSMLIISVMPMLGIELFRLEATPTSLLAIDKMNRQYVQTDYQELNRFMAPELTWAHLQQIATDELPEDAFIGYTVGKHSIALRLTYTERQLDVPVHMTPIRIDRFEPVDISQW